MWKSLWIDGESPYESMVVELARFVNDSSIKEILAKFMWQSSNSKKNHLNDSSL